jgi:hypothetical protein
MKNTESIGWLYDWFTFSPDYVRGMKQKLKTSRNKISMQIPVFRDHFGPRHRALVALKFYMAH